MRPEQSESCVSVAASGRTLGAYQGDVRTQLPQIPSKGETQTAWPAGLASLRAGVSLPGMSLPSLRAEVPSLASTRIRGVACIAGCCGMLASFREGKLAKSEDVGLIEPSFRPALLFWKQG